MPKKTTYKDDQKAAREAMKPRPLSVDELLKLSLGDKPKHYNLHFGMSRRQVRRKLVDRSFTRASGEKAQHIVMDHHLEVEKYDPKFSNHERMKYQKAYRNAIRENLRLEKAKATENA